ncbi:MAG: aldolase/citrate lyase family protein [Fusobacteriaceae bacterium]
MNKKITKMNLMKITDDVEKAKKYELAGIDIIFVDLEINGKFERQGHLDTVISKHQIKDVSKIKKQLTKAQLLVRINPIFDGGYEEIEKVIEYGADIIMLPMFKTTQEVENFVKKVDKRAKVCLLLETSQAMVRIDEILEIEGIDIVHIGLNDLYLSLGLDFMFECLTSGLVDYLAEKIKSKNKLLGVGGIARIGEGLIPSEIILSEHVRLISEYVILSRTFDRGENNLDLKKEVSKIRERYSELLSCSDEELIENKIKIKKLVQKIIKDRKE